MSDCKSTTYCESRKDLNYCVCDVKENDKWDTPINRILRNIQDNHNDVDAIKKIVASTILAGALDSALRHEAIKILQTGEQLA